MHYRLMLLKQDGQLDADFAHIKQLNERYDTARAAFETIPRDANGDAFVQRIESARAATHAADQLLDAALKTGDYPGAVAILLEQVRPHGAAWTQALAEYTDYQSQLTADSRAQYRNVEQRTRLLILVVGALGLLLGCLTAWAINRSLKAPLAGVLALAENIAQGRLDTVVADQGQDEMAQLGRSMQRMQQQVLAVIQAQGELAAAHAAGHIDHRLQADGFPGAYGRMITESNELVDGHVQVQQRLIEVMGHYARGDLTVSMDRLPGERARITEAMDATVCQLRSIVCGISQAAASINVAAGEIATGNNELARRTELQAASLEETAASMEELTSTVRQNAEHARQANQLAITAHSVAAAGGEVTCEVVATMTQIEQSSRKIADIIAVIDGIAFQTNILALNAAVEAARAGEQGRGFAVVASEVRSLAQRSAEAAKEIKGLIDDSVDKVALGSEQVRRAGNTMQEIVTSVQRVTAIMGEISAASQEQSAGIEQVNHTVVQMDEATQQNAALVEEASAAARSMEEQALILTQSVAMFDLGKDSSVPARPVPVHKRAVTAAAIHSAPVQPSKRPAPERVAMPATPADDEEHPWQEF